MVKGPVVVTRARGDAEFTPVSKETEVTVPRFNYRIMLGVAAGVDTAFWLIVWLLWYRAVAKRMSFWYWLSRKWLPRFSLNWPWYIVSLLVFYVLCSLIYLWYLGTEIGLKRQPAYTPWPSEWGAWRPQIFRPFYPPDYEQPSQEMDHETIDVNSWERDQNNRKRMRRATYPIGSAARTFYKVVLDGMRPFSERTAHDCGVSRRQFRRIREALRKQGGGNWKDERNKKQGFEVYPSGLRTLKGILSHVPLPHRRA